MASFAVGVKAGSFTRAATRLRLSKSVVSRHVSALEKALGVQLMYRSTHSLSLTEAGERFYAAAMPLLCLIARPDRRIGPAPCLSRACKA
jgi:DNA-binding transcriptional LysR family regulator